LNNGWLLCIGAGQHQTAVLRQAREMGFSTLAVDLNPMAPGRQAADAFLCHSAWDADGIIKKLPKEIISDIRGVVTQAARGCTLTAARLGEWLELPHLNPETAALFLDKERALRTFNGSNALVFEDANLIPHDLELPFVVKGLTSSGGLGNHFVRTHKELQQLKLITGRVVVEPFFEGRHLGVVGIQHGALLHVYGIVERYLKPNLAVSHAAFPASLDLASVEQLTDYSRHVLNKTNFNFGPFQLELILQPGGSIHFIELEPSILGSYISEWMIPVTGCGNMIADSINLATGNPVKVTNQLPQRVAYNKFYYSGDPFIQHGGPWPDELRLYGDTLHPSNPRQYVANALVSADSIHAAESQIAHLESNSRRTHHYEQRISNLDGHPAG